MWFGLKNRGFYLNKALFSESLFCFVYFQTDIFLLLIKVSKLCLFEFLYDIISLSLESNYNILPVEVVHFLIIIKILQGTKNEKNIYKYCHGRQYYASSFISHKTLLLRDYGFFFAKFFLAQSFINRFWKISYKYEYY